jgi:hypothetical protein
LVTDGSDSKLYLASLQERNRDYPSVG